MKLTVTNKIMVQRAPEKFEAAVKERLTFPNPKWIENDKRGYWNGKTPKQLKFFEQTDNGLIIPRGFIRHLLDMAKAQGIQYHLEDRRRTLPEVDFTFYAIAHRRQSALVMVHTKELLGQWIDRVETFLGIPAKEVGIIGDGKLSLGDQITVALVQSLYKCADKIKDHIGFLIVDECHRIPSRTFTEAVSVFDSKYMLGLSATPWRRDKLSRLIYWSLGDVAHEVSKDQLLKTEDILPITVITRKTEFRTTFNPSEEYSKMLSELTQDTQRNQLIAQDVAREAQRDKGVCLVLSDRKTHCKAIQNLLWCEYKVSSELLIGEIPKAKRESIVGKLNSGAITVLIATGQLIGEGFDCKQLSTLFLATPIKFSGRVIQYLGRVLRPAPGKKRAVVYDYIDSHVGPLRASAKSRLKVYQRAA
jgi:superfamily II DNA or RNA helicase